jgi:hypothetical protein
MLVNTDMEGDMQISSGLSLLEGKILNIYTNH